MIFFKLIREHIVRNKFEYYDPNTFIIEFPVYFCVITKPLLKIPHVKLTTYAILNSCYNFTFREICPSCQPIQTVDLGNCSIQECVWTNITLQNLTFVPQIFLFANVPKVIHITIQLIFYPQIYKILVFNYNAQLWLWGNST